MHIAVDNVSGLYLAMRKLRAQGQICPAPLRNRIHMLRRPLKWEDLVCFLLGWRSSPFVTTPLRCFQTMTPWKSAAGSKTESSQFGCKFLMLECIVLKYWNQRSGRHKTRGASVVFVWVSLAIAFETQLHVG